MNKTLLSVFLMIPYFGYGTASSLVLPYKDHMIQTREIFTAYKGSEHPIQIQQIRGHFTLKPDKDESTSRFYTFMDFQRYVQKFRNDPTRLFNLVTNFKVFRPDLINFILRGKQQNPDLQYQKICNLTVEAGFENILNCHDLLVEFIKSLTIQQVYNLLLECCKNNKGNAFSQIVSAAISGKKCTFADLLSQKNPNMKALTFQQNQTLVPVQNSDTLSRFQEFLLSAQQNHILFLLATVKNPVEFANVMGSIISIVHQGKSLKLSQVFQTVVVWLQTLLQGNQIDAMCQLYYGVSNTHVGFQILNFLNFCNIAAERALHHQGQGLSENAKFVEAMRKLLPDWFSTSNHQKSKFQKLCHISPDSDQLALEQFFQTQTLQLRTKNPITISSLLESCSVSSLKTIHNALGTMAAQVLKWLFDDSESVGRNEQLTPIEFLTFQGITKTYPLIQALSDLVHEKRRARLIHLCIQATQNGNADNLALSLQTKWNLFQIYQDSFDPKYLKDIFLYMVTNVDYVLWQRLMHRVSIALDSAWMMNSSRRETPFATPESVKNFLKSLPFKERLALILIGLPDNQPLGSYLTEAANYDPNMEQVWLKYPLDIIEYLIQDTCFLLEKQNINDIFASDVKDLIINNALGILAFQLFYKLCCHIYSYSSQPKKTLNISSVFISNKRSDCHSEITDILDKYAVPMFKQILRDKDQIVSRVKKKIKRPFTRDFMQNPTLLKEYLSAFKDFVQRVYDDPECPGCLKKWMDLVDIKTSANKLENLFVNTKKMIYSDLEQDIEKQLCQLFYQTMQPNQYRQSIR